MRQSKQNLIKLKNDVWNRDARDNLYRVDSSVVFGGKKIPELMKGLGKGVRSFKEGVKGVETDLDVRDANSDANKKSPVI